MKNKVLKIAAALLLITSWGAGAQTRIDLEAKAAILSGPIVLTNGFISQLTQPDPGDGGRAAFPFTISEPGSYAIQIQVQTTGTNTQSLRVNIDDDPEDPAMVWDIPAAPQVSDRIVTWRDNGRPPTGPKIRKAFQLSAGDHQLIIRGQQPNTKLARVSVLKLPSPPAGLTVEPTGEEPRRPAPPTNLRVLNAGP